MKYLFCFFAFFFFIYQVQAAHVVQVDVQGNVAKALFELIPESRQQRYSDEPNAAYVSGKDYRCKKIADAYSCRFFANADGAFGLEVSDVDPRKECLNKVYPICRDNHCASRQGCARVPELNHCIVAECGELSIVKSLF